MNISKNMRDYFIIIGGLTILGVSGLFHVSREEDKKIFRKLSNKVEIIADINNDGVTSLDEWTKVYQELGIQFNYLHPQELNEDQLNTYLGKHIDRIILREAKYGASLK